MIPALGLRSLRAGGLLLAAALASAAGAQSVTKVADAPPGAVRVIATAAIKVPLDAVIAQAEKAIGKPIVVEYGSARGNLKNEILAGQSFEVAIMLPDVDDALHAAGKVVPGAWGLASVPIAFALRGDAPAPDLGTPAAVKAALLNAKSVKYAPTGAALLTVRKVLDTLGIAAAIKDSSTLREPAPLGPGEYEINIYPVSEIIPNPALKNLGAVIPALQVPAIIDATIGTQANDPAAARALVKFLQGPAIDAALAADGMRKDTAFRP